MTQINPMWTADEQHDFCAMIGDLHSMESCALTPELTAVFDEAGLQPEESAMAKLVSFLTSEAHDSSIDAMMTQMFGSFEEPEDFSGRLTHSTEDSFTTLVFTLDAKTAQSMQFLLMGLAGPQDSPTIDANDPAPVVAAKKFANAIEAAFPNAPSRIKPITLGFADGTQLIIGTPPSPRKSSKSSKTAKAPKSKTP